MSRVRVGLLGSSGRMGRMVNDLLRDEFAERAELAAAARRDPAGKSPANFSALLATDVVIDFSLPEAAIDFAQAACNAPGPLPAFVVGSTGWKLEGRKVLERLAAKTPVLAASNFSTGVMALLEILKSAAPLLERLGYTASIVETHHRHKKDAPSGTAISIQRLISPAGPGNVQTHSVRGGEIIGDHEITFHGVGDHLTLGHFAQNRSIFARGAIDVALWLAARRASAVTGGILSMETYFADLTQGVP